MSFKTSCPHCGQHYELGEEYVGQEVVCEKCGKNFTVSKPEPPKPAPKKKSKPAPIQLTDCSACGGKVHVDAAICPHCGRPRKSGGGVSFTGILQVLLLFFGFPFVVGAATTFGGNIPLIAAIWCATFIIIMRR